jgi:hypothetical protein
VGKNATDSALIIDAMDILYTAGVDGFCIVSSDGDFARLATRIREKNMFVMGIGKANTPRAFVNACEVFVYTENLSKDNVDPLTPPPVRKPTRRTKAAPKAEPESPVPKVEAPKAAEAPAPKKSAKKGKDETAAEEAFKKSAKKSKADALILKPAPKKTVKKAKAPEPPAVEPPAPASKSLISPLSEEATVTLARLFRTAFDMAVQDDGWANLGAIGQFLRQLDPSFDPRTYGHKQLSALVKARDEWFEIKSAEPNSNGVYVRLRPALSDTPSRPVDSGDDEIPTLFDADDDFGSSSDWFVGFDDAD